MKIIKLTKFYHQAFTLVELLVVIAIIGILSTLSIVGLNSARAKARDSRRLSDVREIATALEMYYSDTGVYPLVASATGTLIGGLCLSDLGISSTCGTSVYLKKSLTILRVGPIIGICLVAGGRATRLIFA